MRLKMLPVLILLLPGAIFGAAPPDEEPLTADLILILDASGSMWGQVKGENKIVIARRVLNNLIDTLNPQQRVGLVAYGHRREGDCTDIETIATLAPLDAAALKATVNAINPKGKTPITAALEQAFTLLDAEGRSATAVLLSDGLETCNRDPCALVSAARERGEHFLLHVVGFDVGDEDVAQLECVAQAGGGYYFGAKDAQELAAALDTVATLPAEVPPGRLSVLTEANGELLDSVVHVRAAGSGEDIIGARTYTDAATNPRLLPLADGRYEVLVRAVRLNGDTDREFEIEIIDGNLIEKQFDFSTGRIGIEVWRNGELSDATYNIRVAGSRKSVAGGRTYRSPTHNPAFEVVTAGNYEVEIRSVEIKGAQPLQLGKVSVAPKGEVVLAHEFHSGTLAIEVMREGTLVDAVVSVRGSGGREVTGRRSYANANGNPVQFVLPPGDYVVHIQEIRGSKTSLAVTVPRANEARYSVDMATAPP